MGKATMPSVDERGFGLVETLVAAAIIASMTALTFNVIAANAQAARSMADRRLAIMVARSALDLVDGSITQSSAYGTMSGLVWHSTAEPYSKGVRGGRRPLRLITVTVAPAGAARPLVRLQTLRMGQ